jgi:predicted ATP-dependent serine protease
MATAHGIVLVNNKAEQFSVTARVVPDGDSRLYLRGRVTDTFTRTFAQIIQAIRAMAEYMDCPDLDCADITIRLNTPNDYPLAGSSYGLPMAMAILASANHKMIPNENCYTGGINKFGDVIPVRFIAEKRRAAAGRKFERFFLPRSQIDLFSTYIAQCPCAHLADAYGITFWGEK